MGQALWDIDPETMPFALGPQTGVNREIVYADHHIGELRGPLRRPKGVSFRANFNIGDDAKAQRIIDAFWKWFTERVDKI